MTEPCAVLWGPYHMIGDFTGGGWGCRETGESVEEWWDVAVVLCRTWPRIDASNTNNDDRHHSSLTIFVAVFILPSRPAAPTSRPGVPSVIIRRPEPKHAEEV